MFGLLPRALLAVALLLTWAMPTARLAVLPEQRAQALAVESICRSESAALQPVLLRSASFPGRAANPAVERQLSDVAALFRPAASKQWATELAIVLGVMVAALALLGGWQFAPFLVIAAAISYLRSYDVHWDAFRLLAVTESVRLWVAAVSQWSYGLWLERIAAPLMVWASLFAATGMLLAAATARFRAGLGRNEKPFDSSTVACIAH